ncbi:sodium:proton antiporter, partial [Klebsiella pneumoniae]
MLMAIGLGVSLLPFVPAFTIPPDVILIGVLPPLLYSAALQLPAIEFRRDFAPIAGLSVLLVVLSSLGLGLFFAAVI